MLAIGVETLMDPFVGLADDDSVVNYYKRLGNLDAEKYIQIIRNEILPYYLNLRADVRKKVFKSIAVALDDPEYDFEYVFYSDLPPFDLTVEARVFFLWIYEEILKAENLMQQ